MSWLFSRRVMDEYMPDLPFRIQAQAKRTTVLLDIMPTEEQRVWQAWAENRAAVQGLLNTFNQGWIPEDVFRKAPSCEWEEGNSCACDGHGGSHKSTDSPVGMCSPYQWSENGQSLGESGANESRRAFQDACKAIVQIETQNCRREVCVSLRYLQELAEEYSEGTSLDGEQFAPLSVTPTQHKFWRNDKTIESSDLSRFGLTCAVLTESHGEELLMSYLADSRARTLVKQEVERESTVSDPDYGAKCRELSVRFDLNSCSWKTHLSLLSEDLHWSSVTLPAWGMMLDGAFWEQTAPTLHKGGSGSGWWQTPTVEDAKRNGSAKAWEEYKNTKRTTCCRLRNQVAALDGKDGRMNPDWTEWLMGWPSGWTDLKPLEMDKFREWQQQHSLC